MADYIERQSVYDVLRKAPISNMGTKLSIYDDIADIPAADVVACKTAEWGDDYDGGWSTCSQCGESFLWEDNSGVAAWNFCPNCGARVVNHE